MDAKVDDFLNEINEIAPPKAPKEECLWKECYDELTGYSYYWNLKSDEVTWDKPANFKPSKKTAKNSDRSAPKKLGLYVPGPLFPSTSSKVREESIKIYSVGDSSRKILKPFDPSKKRSPPVLDSSKNTSPTVREKPVPQKRYRRKSSDSDDEKITLISSYGGDSESDAEDEPELNRTKNETNISKHDSHISEDDDDIDILTKIQKRAKELRELGGDLPPEVAKIADIPQSREISPANKERSTESEKEAKIDIAGFSLVAGYSDSEEENEEVRKVLGPRPELPEVSHSTLFPIQKQIDVKDFLQPKVEENEKPNPSGDFDSRAFQRKRRIGVALVNTAKKKEESDHPDNERKGFGFTNDTKPNGGSSMYPGFTKGGVMFVKSDILNPPLSKMDENSCDNKTELVNMKDLKEMYTILVEKLEFLNEGREAVPPTQGMVIQAETLFAAMNAGALKPSYLQKWSKETCEELVKLEKDATPDGWLLLWDRSNKRYYYQNRATGMSQWEYPQAGRSMEDHCDDAMDISTTPPPEQVIRMSPPLPPTIRSPTPPPPPIISRPDFAEEGSQGLPSRDKPLPPDPPSVNFSGNSQPLPPGVEFSDISAYDKRKGLKKEADQLNSALDSFYSEVAAIDTPRSISPNPPPPPPPPDEDRSMENLIADSFADFSRKKKKKVKLAPGLSLKKKGVSQLVEKWKNVQQQYQ